MFTGLLTNMFFLMLGLEQIAVARVIIIVLNVCCVTSLMWFFGVFRHSELAAELSPRAKLVLSLVGAAVFAVVVAGMTSELEAWHAGDRGSLAVIQAGSRFVGDAGGIRSRARFGPLNRRWQSVTASGFLVEGSAPVVPVSLELTHARNETISHENARLCRKAGCAPGGEIILTRTRRTAKSCSDNAHAARPYLWFKVPST